MSLNRTITLTNAATGRPVVIACGFASVDFLSAMRPEPPHLAPHTARAYVLRTNFRSVYVRETPNQIDAMVRVARLG